MNYKNNIESEYAYMTECNLATLAGLLMRKSSPKNEIKRQTGICLKMLTVCKAHESAIDWGDEYKRPFGRVADIFADAKQQARGLEDSLNWYIEKVKS